MLRKEDSLVSSDDESTLSRGVGPRSAPAACGATCRQRSEQEASPETPTRSATKPLDSGAPQRVAGRSAKKGVAKRTLKRRPSSGRPPAPNVIAVQCLWGGSCRIPTVIWPTTVRGDKNFMPIHEHLYWLRRACDQTKGQTHWSDRFQYAVSKLRKELRAGLEDASFVSGGTETQIPDLVDEDIEARQTMSRLQVAKRKRLPADMTEVTVSLAGTPVVVRVHERPFEVEATPEAIIAVVRFCRQRVQDTPIILAKQKSVAALDSPQSTGTPSSACTSPAAAGDGDHFCFNKSACPGVLQKVTWHPSVNAWCAHYKAADGTPKQTRFVVRVSSPAQADRFRKDGGQGNYLDRFNMQRRVKYIDAIEYWNTQDCSTRDRIKIDDQGSQG